MELFACAVAGFFVGRMSRLCGCGNYSSVFSNSGNIVTMNGKRMTSSFGGWSSPEATSLRLVAIDANGKELDNFSLPAKGDMKIILSAVDGSIDEVKTSSADITIENVHHINTLKSTSGDIKIRQVHGDIHNISATSGDIKVDSVGNIGPTKTIAGDIKVRSLSATRDESPGRHSSKDKKKKKNKW
jgi:hypothetical protein